MKIFRIFCLPLLGAIIITAGCKTEEITQSAAAPPAEAQAPTLSHPATLTPQPRFHATFQPKPDPIPDLVKQVEAEYAKGEANYRTGHLEAARENFDNAFDILLTSPTGVHSDERLEREFDKIVEGVNRLEMLALKEGDGFTRQRSEPAPIDEANEVTFPIDPAVRAKAEAELRQTRSDLPLVMNDQVASFVNYFSAGKGRGAMEHGLIRAGRYREMISRVLREEGVPQDLIYLAQAESGFHPLALSRAGARGMWQFMASRASGYGLERNWWVDERQDPEKSTRAAARHLKDLYNQFGDWYLAMAAYNSGPGTVQRAVERTGYADFWELYRRNVLPGETRNYVPIILAVTIVAKNPSQYGFDRLPPEVSPAVDVVKVNYAADLRLVAECVDAPVSILQDLNPSLLRMTTPKDAEFNLRLPAGTAERFQAAIAAIPLEMRTQWRYHKVQPGETLSQVAQRYHASTRAIAQVNNLDEDAVLQKDAKLIIPVTAVRRVASESDSTVAAAAVVTSYSQRPVMHTARKGETALSVADDYAVPVEMVRKWNHLHGNQLRAGQTLRIYKPVGKQSARETRGAADSRNTRQSPASHERASASIRGGNAKAKASARASFKISAKAEPRASAKISSRAGTSASSGSKASAKAEARASRAASSSTKATASKTTAKGTAPTAKGKPSLASADKSSRQRVHKVRRGDTLASIAGEYNTSVAALKRDNGKASGNLRPGQVLVIK
jgi:membrane-bound lytic murein transglycosylase D